MVKTYCLACRRSQVFVFALVYSLIFLIVFFAINVTILLCVWKMLDRSLCVTCETLALSGRSDAAKVTILLSFASSFSKAAVSKALQ